MATTKDQEQINEQDKVSEMESKTITAYKGFDKDLKCRDFQYEIGKTYKHEGDIKVCGAGFHACESPLNVFDYYPPANTRFCEVELSGDMDGCNSDTKLAAATITIKAELNLHQYIENAVAWIFSKTKKADTSHNEDDNMSTSNSGYQGAASNTGHQGAASNSGDRGAASNSGDRGAASNSGYQGAASNTGDRGAASNSGARGAASNTGDRGAASNSGYQGAASNTGYQGAASNSGYQGAASNSGVRGAASNSGDRGAASNSGYQGAASTTGEQSTAMACGYKGNVSGSEGCALFLVERNDEYEIVNVWSGIAGQEGIKPDVYYTLINGAPVELSEDG